MAVLNAPTVAVLDYGSGNLRSAERALARARADVVVTDDLDVARRVDGLVVPGVGAYAACMAGVDAINAGPMIADRLADGRQVLGICVGHADPVRVRRGARRRHEGARLPERWRDPARRRTGTAHGVEYRPISGVVAALRRCRSHRSVLLRPLVRSDATDPDALVTTAAHDAPFIAAVEAGPLDGHAVPPGKVG